MNLGPIHRAALALAKEQRAAGLAQGLAVAKQIYNMLPPGYSKKDRIRKILDDNWALIEPEKTA